MSKSILDFLDTSDVKDADNLKRPGLHLRTGEPVYNPLKNRVCRHPSVRENAKAGAMLPQLALRCGVTDRPLSAEARDLLDECREGDKWIDRDGNVMVGSKALLDDSASGGQHAVPTWFDDNIVETSLLTNELLPKIDLRDVPRGSAVETVSISPPTVQWGTGDGTSMSLLDTADFISDIAATIFPVTVAIELGRDFLSDAVPDMGARLQGMIGMRLGAELDKVIAVGNGTSQPQGLTNASGVASVSSENGAGGPWTLSDAMSLYFGVAKQYRTAAFSPCFVSNDTLFQRWRSIKIDTASPSTDQRPALAPLADIGSYRSLQQPHCIQNDIGNRTAMFACLGKYRLWRRAGLELRFVDGGATLARKNLVLLIARARFGGRLVDANAAAACTDGQS